MKAVVIAAGKGTRMYPLTLTTPKLLLPVLGVPLLDWFDEILADKVNELIIVVNPGESGEQIRRHVKASDYRIKVSFVVQKEQKGTAHALQVTKDAVGTGKFLLLNGDDLYSREDIEHLLEKDAGIVGTPVEDPEKWGIITADDRGKFTGIVEKPDDKKPGSLANIGMYLFNASVFELFDRIEESPRGEYEITDTVKLYAQENDFSVVESAGYWFPLGYPWHLLDVNKQLFHHPTCLIVIRTDHKINDNP